VGDWTRGPFAASTFRPEVCTFSPDGSRLVAWANDELAVLEVQARPKSAPLATRLATHKATYTPGAQVLLAADNRRLLTVTSRDDRLAELNQPNLAGKVEGHQAKIVRAAFNPSGSVLATLDEQNVLRIRSMQFVNRPGDELTGHSLALRDIQFTPDGEKLLARGDAGIFVWRVPNPPRKW
jgi:WD40 repeat protein